MANAELNRVQRDILAMFSEGRALRLPTRELFETLQDYSNAQIVRAVTDLQTRHRLVVRHTHQGVDWIDLTDAGASVLGLGRGR
jgi:hypothetical protein